MLKLIGILLRSLCTLLTQVVPPLRRLIVNHSGVAYASTLAGIPSFFLTTLKQRSISISLGTSLGLLVHLAMLWGNDLLL